VLVVSDSVANRQTSAVARHSSNTSKASPSSCLAARHHVYKPVTHDCRANVNVGIHYPFSQCAPHSQTPPPHSIWASNRPLTGINTAQSATNLIVFSSQPLEALTAVVIDAYENRIPAADVTFRILIGDAKFEGEGASTDGQSITVKSDKSGFAAVRPRLGAQAGEILVGVSAPGEGETVEGYPLRIMALKATDGATGFRGVVQNDRGQPLPGAKVSITRTNLLATTDDKGRFQFDANVPAGRVDLFIDGRTINVQAQQYPTLHFEATAVPGVINELPHPVYLPQLAMSEAKIVGGDQDVILKMPGYEGYEMIVKAGSVIFPDGSRVGPLVVSPIAADKLPMTPPGGYSAFMAPAATLQPSGTRFDPPVQLKLPNTGGLVDLHSILTRLFHSKLTRFIAV
jgi:hypothetical protein